MYDEDEDVCPICHKHSLYTQCTCFGEWTIGCDECEIETGVCGSYEEAEQEWQAMMKNRKSFVVDLNK